MEDMSRSVRGPLFEFIPQPTRNTVRRNGRARLKQFGDNQRMLFRKLMDGVCAEFPVRKEGIQPADEIVEEYWFMDGDTYEGFFSAIREHVYKINGIQRYTLSEQGEALKKLNLHRTVTILLDIEDMQKSDSPEEQDRGTQVERLLQDHFNSIVSILSSEMYHHLLWPISYESLKNLRNVFENPQKKLDSNLMEVVRREYNRWGNGRN